MITKYGNLDTRLWAWYTPPMLVNAHSTQTTRGCFKQNSRTDMQILSTRANVENQLKLKINFSLCHARSRACNHVFVFSYADYCTKTIRSQVSQCIFCDLFVWSVIFLSLSRIDYQKWRHYCRCWDAGLVSCVKLIPLEQWSRQAHLLWHGTPVLK